MNSFDHLVVPTDNLAVVCRLCLSMSEKLFQIFRLDELETMAITLAMKVSLCTTLKMSKHDPLPQKVCENCFSYINGWYQYRKKCQVVDSLLKKYVAEHKETESSRKLKYLDFNLDDTGMDDQFDDVLLESALPQSDVHDAQRDLDEEPTFTDLDKCQTYPLDQQDALVEAPCEVFLPKRRKMFKCTQCPDSFYYLKDLVQHKIMLHREKRPKSSDIRKKRERKLMQAKKEVKLAGLSSRTRYEMKCCDKVFYSKARFSRHYRKRHPGEKPFMCDTCGKKDFISEETLKRHKVLHSGRFRCEVCGKTFTCNAILLIHKRDKHEDDKPFVCDVCGKRFVTELLMNYHKRFHTGEKKYVCPECGLAVVTSSSLAKHRRTHSSVKPHICEVCGKGFIIKGRLVEHQRLHTGERPYTCDVCHKGFTMRDKLRRHLRIHSGEKLFSCEYCGNNYSTSYGLSVHLRSHVRHL